MVYRIYDYPIKYAQYLLSSAGKGKSPLTNLSSSSFTNFSRMLTLFLNIAVR